MVTMKAKRPSQSNGARAVALAFDSGVPRIRRKLATATAIDIQKIQRQPTVEATKPPKSALRPEPPHEPMDQKLIARWRSAPSK